MKPISTWFWFKNMTAPGSNPANGAYLYAESGLMKVRQADGTIITIGNATADPSFPFFIAS